MESRSGSTVYYAGAGVTQRINGSASYTWKADGSAYNCHYMYYDDNACMGKVDSGDVLQFTLYFANRTFECYDVTQYKSSVISCIDCSKPLYPYVHLPRESMQATFC